MNIVFDIGGTTMRVATSETGDNLDRIKKEDTPSDGTEGLEKLISIIEKLTSDSDIDSIIGGIAGVSKSGLIKYSPNLPGWNDLHLANLLGDYFDVGVSIYNDADLGALGEAKYGAGEDATIVSYITVGTGVGGGRVIDEEIDSHFVGFEPGHQIITAEGDTLESLVSGSSVEAKYGRHPKDITDESVWDELSEILAQGLANTILHWSPEILVLGGSMVVNDDAYIIDDLYERVDQLITVLPELPTFTKAELLDDAGLYGALATLSQ